jgi:RNA polymerase sigma-70 factor, ECF subfamily
VTPPLQGVRSSAGTAVHPGSAPRRVEEPDEAVVQRVLAGRREEFEVLVRRHHRSLYNYIFRMVGSADLAADLTQEVFLKVYTALDRFDPAFRFTTWLYRIAFNRVIDHVRRRRAMLLPLESDGGDAPSPDGESPERRLLDRESAGEVARALADLPTEYRDLIVLRHFQHRSYDEIAALKGSPLGTVKNRLFRAREALRRSLAP